MTDKIRKTAAEWAARLSPEVYRVAREHGTERAFSGAYWDHHDAGVYHCACCDTALFASDAKFDSGTGWPSFGVPVDLRSIGTTTDRSWFMVRTEVHCAGCEAHLGHLFDDGPAPGGQRYCINSASLQFLPTEAPGGVRLPQSETGAVSMTDGQRTTAPAIGAPTRPEH